MKGKREGIGNLYHQETNYRREAMSGGGLDWTRQPSPYKEFQHPLRQIPLRSPDTGGEESLWKAIAQRRSCRDFSSRPMTYSDLSRLIWATQGITSRAWGYEFRAVPSAGALYPIETYVVANRVEEIPAGIYHYQPRDERLILLKEGSFGHDLHRAGMEQEMLEEAACVFIWTAVVERSRWKYKERAYRYLYMDAGHIGQNLYLAATGLGLGCCTVGAFFDEEVDRLIGVDGREEITVYLGAVGGIRKQA